jgi:uncharacterized membrane protein HdeD (DUF308 family)
MLEVSHLSHHWWVFAVRGAAAMLFGVMAFIWPMSTLAALVLLWGAYALVDGVLAVVSAMRAGQDHRLLLMLEGLAGIGAGIVTFVWPGLTAMALLYIIAAWALVTGVFELVSAIRLRKVIQNEWLLALSGVASVLFGIILIVAPGAGALALIGLIGAYAIIFGVLLLALALQLRARDQRLHAPAPA